jgi:hypothetical protein
MNSRSDSHWRRLKNSRELLQPLSTSTYSVTSFHEPPLRYRDECKTKVRAAKGQERTVWHKSVTGKCDARAIPLPDWRGQLFQHLGLCVTATFVTDWFSRKNESVLSAVMMSSTVAPVAQLDRALPSEGKGHTFESCRVRQTLDNSLGCSTSCATCAFAR